jgi:hypothetical protein
MLPKNSVGAEIGVHHGHFSQQMLEIVAPRELHLIDPWKHESSPTYKEALYGGRARGGQNEMDERYFEVCARFARDVRKTRVRIHRGTSAEVLHQFPDGYFDWVYIDGNHLYEYVKQDLELAAVKTRARGFITGDDYTGHAWWKDGVMKAVDEFAGTGLASLIEIRNRQFIFQKPIPSSIA